ncbi:MAG: SPFH domain-containing protein [Elusimicrobiota bacterium]|nr:SPFH domain-containing protein [Elusimicrobiota bacterium]
MLTALLTALGLGGDVAFAIGVLIFFAAFIFVYNSIVIVGGTQLAVLERRWLGTNLPEGRVVAMAHEVGIQARILGPGLHLLIPFLYRTEKAPMMIVAENEVGLVESIDGAPVPPGRIFGKALTNHNLFQDGEAFLTAGGEKGPQVQILPPGAYRINPYLFKVVKRPALRILNNKIGVVVATDGQPMTSGRLLGKRVTGHESFQNGQAFLEQGGQKGPQIDILLPGSYRVNTAMFQVEMRDAVVIPAQKVGMVTAKDGEPLPASEYVAKSAQGHKDFQDGAAFLAAGGQRGPQLDFLKPGTYYVNPLMFDATFDEVLQVARGEVSVIVSNIGKDPAGIGAAAGTAHAKPEDRLKDGIERYVVDSGYRGIQREVLGPGTYYLNKLAYTPHIIPTTNITIDWAEEKTQNRGERAFNPLSIVSKDGFQMTVEVKVILRVLPEQAPHMVARIGTIDNLIEHVVHPLIDSSFRNQSSSTEAMKFMQDRHEEQRKAGEHIVEELRRYHVECVSVLICQIVLPERLMQTLTSKVVAAQQMSMFDAQQSAEARRREMEKTKAQADLQPSLVKAEIDVQIATQSKQSMITNAEGRSQATRLEQEGVAAGISAVGKAEGDKILAIGNATAEAYVRQAAAVGQGPLAMIEVMKRVSDGKIKITPDIMVSGGNGAGNDGASANMLAAFMASLMGSGMKLVPQDSGTPPKKINS